MCSPGTEQFTVNTVQKKKDSTWPIRRSALVTKELQIAPGISSPQLPTCIQFCCSYLIFYEAFICVYRNNKAIFFSLYGLSQELLPDVLCFRILVFFPECGQTLHLRKISLCAWSMHSISIVSFATTMYWFGSNVGHLSTK